MKKKNQQPKKWRRINPYICKGCSKKRLSFNHSRAHVDELCTRCQRNVPDKDQLPLL